VRRRRGQRGRLRRDGGAAHPGAVRLVIARGEVWWADLGEPTPEYSSRPSGSTLGGKPGICDLRVGRWPVSGDGLGPARRTPGDRRSLEVGRSIVVDPHPHRRGPAPSSPGCRAHLPDSKRPRAIA
jgi:hypothetical protein